MKLPSLDISGKNTVVDDNSKLNESANDNELEELVLRECILSATGLDQDSVQIGIKGDPSLRETTLQRKRYESPVDKVIQPLVENLEELLVNRSTYRIFIGFNSGEIRTHSIFDPLRQEIHEAEKLADKDYVDRHYPKISFEDKIQAMRDIYESIAATSLFEKMPGYWKNIFTRRHENWDPMTPEEVHNIMSSIKLMRDLPDFYLRNITICIVQNMVRMQFNCDGTQIISAENYQKFIEENMP